MLVSVIIPVYNGEEHIHTCLGNLLNQTLKDIEFIFINDGSADNSLRILEAYKENDLRIRIINQDNQGPSSARNKGLDFAKGKYIGFVDIDDDIERNMFEILTSSLEKSNCDLALCNFTQNYTQSHRVFNNLPWNSNEILTNKIIREELIPSLLGIPTEKSNQPRVYGSVCRGLYKNENIQKYDIRFPEDIRFSEDLIFNIKYLLKTDRAIIISEHLYHYKMDSSSSTRKYMPSMFISSMLSNKYLQCLLSDINYPVIYNDYLTWRWRALAINCIINVLRSGNTNSKLEKIGEISEILEYPNVVSAFRRIKIRNVPVKKWIVYYLIKRNCSSLLYSYYSFKIKRLGKD